MNIPGLRSPYEKTGGIFHFARMLDKIRLHAAGNLPEDYHPGLGNGFDSRILSLLQVEYPALTERVTKGGSDEEILAWCFTHGRKPSDIEIEVWNEFMRKCGWNDSMSPRLEMRLKEGGLENRSDIRTFFDYIDLDEGRDPAAR